jgi:succinoglycan biosynthesis protein ExoU
MTSATGICVIIAARDAASTIGRAIRSALGEPEIVEIVVVDDGSQDRTAGAALAADDGTGRLAVLRPERNRGPAFARNHAIAHSAAPLLAILDADDFFLPGRFARLLAQPDWDLIADNIVFLDAAQAAANPQAARIPAAPRLLGLAEFIDGNVSEHGARRGEMGFLKPVIRRAFLDRHGLRYREDLRLGEDYELYVRALARGGRYRIIHSCGYGAVVRHDSLSGRHRTEDLKRLLDADLSILESEELDREAATALTRHARHLHARHALREFLDIKSNSGLAAAGFHALANPRKLPAVVGGIVRDKIDAFTTRGAASRTGPATPRYLLDGDAFRNGRTEPR